MRRSLLKSMSIPDLVKLRARVEAALSGKVGQHRRAARKPGAGRRGARTARRPGKAAD